MAEISEEAATELLGQAFGNTPKPPVVAKAAPEVVDAPMTTAEEEIPTEVVEEEEGEETPVLAEPEFEIDTPDGKEIIKGEQVKELLQKGRDYSKKTDEVARAREALIAQAQQQETAQKFQMAVLSDLIELQTLDKQLAEYAAYDWATAIDQDFIQTQKLQMQWQRLKDMRSTKFQELSAKQTEWQQGQAQAAQQVLVAEHKALLAKLPQWANSETAAAEKQAIGKVLREYGYQDNELSLLTDHRAMLVARDAMKWRELQRNKTERVKQAREAPPVNKPGAAASQQAPRDASGKFLQQFRNDGRKGNHRAQEESLQKVLSRTFKSS